MRKRNPRGKPKTTCSQCGHPLESNRLGKQSYCNACHAQYMRLTRPSYSSLTPEQRAKSNARAYLKVYIRRGKIKKLPCFICGNPNTEAHHHDYKKPLEVTWLCKDHHDLLHTVAPTIPFPSPIAESRAATLLQSE